VKLHFFLVEDQIILRQLLKSHLQTEFPGCRISEAGSLAEVRGLEKTIGKIDLAIIDLELPDGNALDWVEAWVKTPTEPRAIILSAISEDYILFRALHSNLPGFVHKSDNTEMLHLAIRTVLAGGVFFSPTVQRMRSRMQVDPDFFEKVLTEREQTILGHLGQGLSNEEVAQLLGLKESSIADHRKNIMNKLNLHNQAELMRYAVKKGFSRI
jgi:DNA-binding NarL/FixJ family response regulator